MRKIKFRGLRKDGFGWVYGSLIQNNDGTAQIFCYDKHGVSGAYEIDHETVGQFTGLTDKNGNEIYEGDKGIGMNGNEFTVKWNEPFALFIFCLKDSYRSFDACAFGASKKNGEAERIGFEVTGNIHDKTK